MTNRTFDLHMAPPVVLEIKHGKKSEKGYPTKLDGMIVVTREKIGGGDKANFNRADDVMEALKVDPVEGLVKKIPIRLISDDPAESFHIYRGMYAKGKLACGANYGDKMAMRRFKNSEWVEPYQFECSEDCPMWNREKDPCDLGGTLYCNLGEGMPRSGDLVLYRLNGRHAQRRMLASLKILEARCGGIMAGLPLQIAFYSELVKDGTGKMRSVPIVVVEQDDRFNLDDCLLVELERRRKIADVKKAILGDTLKAITTNLFKKGMLKEIQHRELVSGFEENDDVELNASLDEEGVKELERQDAETISELCKEFPKSRRAYIKMVVNNNLLGDGTVDMDAVRDFMVKNAAKVEA